MWSIIFALPNLNMGKPIGNENIAIVPHNDLRITEIASKSQFAEALAENFEDQFGQKQYPSFLIISNTASKHLKDIDAIVGFRNIIAISTIIEGHEHSFTSTFVSLPLYSEYFDFYPISITKNDDGFLTQSPSMLGYDDEQRRFAGQTTPGLASPKHFRLDKPGQLFDPLHKVWQRRYLRKRNNEWTTQTLFRSLEMAYQASTMPFKNHSTIYDYGASASLWVSAFEILSHPKKGKANLTTVLDLLGKYIWSHKKINRRSYLIKHGGVTKHVNLSQKLYKELYDTRNAFLHGDRVTANRLKPFRKKSSQVITRFALLLYKIALLNYIEQFKDKRSLRKQKRYSSLFFDERNLAEALLKAK